MGNVFIGQQPGRPRRRSAGPGDVMKGIFDLGFTVAETIKELDEFSYEAADLQWVIANKKGKIKKWAKAEIKKWAETPPEEPPN